MDKKLISFTAFLISEQNFRAYLDDFSRFSR